jgi:hypothetical protein
MFDSLTAELETMSPTSSERERADCSGAVLGVLGVLVANGLAGLEQLPDTVAGDAETIELTRATMRVEGWALAGRAQAVAQLYARTLAEDQRSGQARASHRYDAGRLTRSEVAANVSLELTISLPTDASPIAPAAAGPTTPGRGSSSSRSISPASTHHWRSHPSDHRRTSAATRPF